MPGMLVPHLSYGRGILRPAGEALFSPVHACLDVDTRVAVWAPRQNLVAYLQRCTCSWNLEPLPGRGRVVGCRAMAHKSPRLSHAMPARNSKSRSGCCLIRERASTRTRSTAAQSIADLNLINTTLFGLSLAISRSSIALPAPSVGFGELGNPTDHSALETDQQGLLRRWIPVPLTKDVGRLWPARSVVVVR